MIAQATVEIPGPHYSLYNIERNGTPAVVVLNDSALSFADRDIFPWHLEVVIHAKKTRKKGMPTRAECSVLDELGDAIEELLEGAKTSLGSLNVLLLARVTCDTRRELTYRVHDPEVANATLQRATSQLTDREWEFTMSSDQAWDEVSVFESLATSCKQ